MAGIYIHIPFCRKACHYCNFHFSTSLHRKASLLQALQAEIAWAARHEALPLPVETLYIGGGTPSLLSQLELEALIHTLQLHYPLASGAEITLEANPDDITQQQLAYWQGLGINRLSIGVQSFRQADLSWMNRAHNHTQALQSIDMATRAGFTDLSIDLIYGTPTLSDADWLAQLSIAHRLGINHLSCYALTVEPHTALHHFVQKGKVPPVDDGRQARHMDLLMDWAAAHGWEHYEISNLCRPGHRSRHNSAYWTGAPYRGFGPSGHSFDGYLTRTMAVANNALYTAALLEKGHPLYETETLTPAQRLNEYLMTALRHIEGISLQPEAGNIGPYAPAPDLLHTLLEQLYAFEARGWVAMAAGKAVLTRQGMHFADAIAADLFVEPDAAVTLAGV